MTLRKHIPNSITSMNLLCGVLGVIFSLDGKLETAFVLMLLAAVFDFCDGLSARLLKAYSDVGKELDSLSDVVSFGVLPSVMLYCVFGTQSQVLRLFPLLIAAFSALRLAKFNLDTRQTSSFIGLPTPANALFWASLTVTQLPFLVSQRFNAIFLFLFMLMFSFFLVAEVPLFALKFKNLSWADNRVKWIFIAGTLIAAVAMGVSAIPVIILWYIALSLLAWRLHFA